MGFGLLLYGDLELDDDGVKLMKQYNQLAAHKYYLEGLVYDHSKINKTARS